MGLFINQEGALIFREPNGLLTRIFRASTESRDYNILPSHERIYISPQAENPTIFPNRIVCNPNGPGISLEGTIFNHPKFALQGGVGTTSAIERLKCEDGRVIELGQASILSLEDGYFTHPQNRNVKMIGVLTENGACSLVPTAHGIYLLDYGFRYNDSGQLTVSGKIFNSVSQTPGAFIENKQPIIALTFTNGQVFYPHPNLQGSSLVGSFISFVNDKRDQVERDRTVRFTPA